MRLTCLRCGHQIDVPTQHALAEGYLYCVCGTEHVVPHLLQDTYAPSPPTVVFAMWSPLSPYHAGACTEESGEGFVI